MRYRPWKGKEFVLNGMSGNEICRCVENSPFLHHRGKEYASLRLKLQDMRIGDKIPDENEDGISLTGTWTRIT